MLFWPISGSIPGRVKDFELVVEAPLSLSTHFKYYQGGFCLTEGMINTFSAITLKYHIADTVVSRMISRPVTLFWQRAGSTSFFVELSFMC